MGRMVQRTWYSHLLQARALRWLQRPSMREDILRRDDLALPADLQLQRMGAYEVSVGEGGVASPDPAAAAASK